MVADLEYHFDLGVPKLVPLLILMTFQSGELKEADSFRIGGMHGLFLLLPLLDIEVLFICLSRCRGRPGKQHKGDNEGAGLRFQVCFLT